MPQIDEAETQVLSLVDLEWLTGQKGQGHMCALVPHPDWHSLHSHRAVLMLTVQGPWALVFCVAQPQMASGHYSERLLNVEDHPSRIAGQKE